jgi:hypothetical protein
VRVNSLPQLKERKHGIRTERPNLGGISCQIFRGEGRQENRGLSLTQKPRIPGNWTSISPARIGTHPPMDSVSHCYRIFCWKSGKHRYHNRVEENREEEIGDNDQVVATPSNNSSFF